LRESKIHLGKEVEKMNFTDLSIIAAGVALLMVAGWMFYLMFKGKKENCCEVRYDPNSTPSGGSRPVGSLADGTNDGLQPGPFWGVFGAPWQTPSERVNPEKNLKYNTAQSTTGWGYSPYLEPPNIKSWWGPQYNWYFTSEAWDAGISINLFHEGDKMCMDNYKKCLDALGPYPDMRCKVPFEQCVMSIPKPDEVSIGH
jgi:hypothetical protein